MMLKRPHDDPRVMSLVSAIRTRYNVWGWLLVLTILALNLLIMSSDYTMMREGAFQTTDYKVTGYEVEEQDGTYYIKVDIENHSAEECQPWILEIKNEDGKTMELLRAQRYFRFRSINGIRNPAAAIPPQARGSIIFEIQESLIGDQEEIRVTFDNLDITELKIELS